MKNSMIVGFILVSMAHCAEQRPQERVFVSNSCYDISQREVDYKSTVDFCVQTDPVNDQSFKGSVAHVSGICYGTGPHGPRLAAIAAQSFKLHMASYLRQRRDTFLSEGKFQEARQYVRSIFAQVHDYLTKHHKHFLTDNTCGVALVYQDSIFERLASFHLAQEHLCASEGFKEDLQHDLHKGGIEKNSSPSERIVSFAPNSFLLMGNPKTVKYLKSPISIYVKSESQTMNTQENMAQVLSDNSGIRFQWYADDLGDYRLLTCHSS